MLSTAVLPLNGGEVGKDIFGIKNDFCKMVFSKMEILFGHVRKKQYFCSRFFRITYNYNNVH